jgi:RNA polymerase-associated protein CTR9
MYQALKNTEKALHIAPSDKTTHYNLALVQQSYAQQISDLPQDQRTSSNIRRALSCLECGQRTFRMLINVNEHTLYEKKIVEQRERYGETLRTQLNRMMTDQIKYEEEKERRLNLARQNRETERAKLRQAEEEDKRLREIEKQKMEDSRRRLMEKVREDNLAMASQQVEDDEFDEEKKAAKKRGRKRRERDDEDGEGEGRDEEDEHEKLLKKKDKKVIR